MHVFFTAELTFESNMVVLNTNVIQHQFQNNAQIVKKMAEELAAQGQGPDAKGQGPDAGTGSKTNSPTNITATAAGLSSSSLTSSSLVARRRGSANEGQSLTIPSPSPGSLKSQASFKKLNRFEKAASRVHIGGVGGGSGGVDLAEVEEEKHNDDDDNVGEELLGRDKTGGGGGGGGRGGHVGVVHRSIDSVLQRSSKQDDGGSGSGSGRKKSKNEEKAGFFSILHTHHTLPVFASGCVCYILSWSTPHTNTPSRPTNKHTHTLDPH